MMPISNKLVTRSEASDRLNAVGIRGVQSAFQRMTGTGFKVIPAVTDLLPPGHSIAVFVELIPVSVYVLPALCKVCGFRIRIPPPVAVMVPSGCVLLTNNVIIRRTVPGNVRVIE